MTARNNQVQLKLLHSSARTAVLEIMDGGHYETKAPWWVQINDSLPFETRRSITLLYGLKPDSRIHVSLYRQPDEVPVQELEFETEKETVTLNVREFGAKGDGENDDTLFLQAAIWACPEGGRVVVPAGVYRFRCLQLKSDLAMCLEKGAVLKAFTDEDALPLLPGEIQMYDESGEFRLGTWEGNPLPMRMGLVSAQNAQRIFLYGEGVIDGNASADNWWRPERVKALPARPRLFFLSHCKDVVIQGITFRNSPAWTIHPYFSENLYFFGCAAENPEISPNTDGLDPESCSNVQVIGMRFSLGDDCIAIKSGKIYMARQCGTPSRHIVVRKCLLENGHGAVTVGSEIAAGVQDVLVEDCLFCHTDRGLRIKTRRGRGDTSVLDRITFRRIRMEEVLSPFVINSFYYCDPDGHTSYVSSREPLPVDERTPSIGEICFEDIECEDAHFRAAHIEGLPEQKIRRLAFRNVSIRMAEEPREGTAAMAEGVPATRGEGMFIRNVEHLVLDNVSVTGTTGPAMDLDGIGQIEE